jgi:poly(A) polymerase
MERIWQEFNKMAKSPRFGQAIIELFRLGLLSQIFPALKEMDLQTIQERVIHFQQFPPGSPAILYLMELFPNASLEERLELCQYLKTSLYEGKLVEFSYKGKHLLTQEELFPDAVADIDWAKFYAHRLYRICFDVLTARFPEAERSELLQRHGQRHERLLPHIQRIIDKKPLVTAAVLQDYGILPGKQMGALLKEAERLAIIHDIHDPAMIVTLLRETPLWPKS